MPSIYHLACGRVLDNDLSFEHLSVFVESGKVREKQMFTHDLGEMSVSVELDLHVPTMSLANIL